MKVTLSAISYANKTMLETVGHSCKLNPKRYIKYKCLKVSKWICHVALLFLESTENEMIRLRSSLKYRKKEAPAAVVFNGLRPKKTTCMTYLYTR